MSPREGEEAIHAWLYAWRTERCPVCLQHFSYELTTWGTGRDAPMRPFSVTVHVEHAEGRTRVCKRCGESSHGDTRDVES